LKVSELYFYYFPRRVIFSIKTCRHVVKFFERTNENRYFYFICVIFLEFLIYNSWFVMRVVRVYIRKIFSLFASLISGARKTERAIPFIPASSFVSSNNKILLTPCLFVFLFRSIPELFFRAKRVCLILNVTQSPGVHYPKRLKLRMEDIINLPDSSRLSF